jgi:hypothetical protein
MTLSQTNSNANLDCTIETSLSRRSNLIYYLYILELIWRRYWWKKIIWDADVIMMSAPGHHVHIAQEPYSIGPHPQADPVIRRNASVLVNAAGGRALDARRGTRPDARMLPVVVGSPARVRVRHTRSHRHTTRTSGRTGWHDQATWRPLVGPSGCRASGSVGRTCGISPAGDMARWKRLG